MSANSAPNMLRLTFEWDASGRLFGTLIGSDPSDCKRYGPLPVPDGEDLRDYCRRTADAIENSIGKPLQWSMPTGQKLVPQDMTAKAFCDVNGVPVEHRQRVMDAIRNDPKGFAKTNFMGTLIIPGAYVGYFASVASGIIREAEEEKRFIQEEEERVAAVVRTMPITSTNGFEGYRIVEYGGYVSGDEAIALSDSLFSAGDFQKDNVNDKIKQIRATAIEELKVAAAEIGCNAVVGLDFDYVTIDRQRQGLRDVTINTTFIILTANGTAVTIEPIE